jgi:DNA processing protein
MEAGEKSGAMITAAFAAEQGREVFAVPGSIYSPQSKGTNQLIREGAHILLSSQDVLEVLNLENVLELQTARSVLPANATEAKLMDVLGNELYIDDIYNVSALPIELVTSTLTVMELKGMVRKVGPMRYIAIHENRAEYET